MATTKCVSCAGNGVIKITETGRDGVTGETHEIKSTRTCPNCDGAGAVVVNEPVENEEHA